MEFLSESQKILLIGLYKNRPKQGYKFQGIKGLCPSERQGIIVFAARKLCEKGLIKCQDDTCTYANITYLGTKCVEDDLLIQEPV